MIHRHLRAFVRITLYQRKNLAAAIRPTKRVPLAPTGCARLPR
jgi:hypothetical protein